VNVDAVVSDKKKTTMLDLAGSPSFNYEAAAVSLNTANATRISRQLQSDSVEMDRREKIHRALQNFGLATAGASIASPPTALFTEIAGSIADLTDGILYSLEGEHGNAALSYASILPVVGAAVAAKRGMKLAEKANEELIDVYHGFESRFTKHNIIESGGEKVAVGRQHRFFEQMDDNQLEYLFKNSVPNPEDGMNLLKRYKDTGEIPLSIMDLEVRMGPKQYKAMGYSRKEYIDDLYEQNQYKKDMFGEDRLYDNLAPVKLRQLGRDYIGGRGMSFKNPFYQFVEEDKFVDVAKKSQYFTTPRMVWASTELGEATKYGESVLHFKIPKSYLLEQIQKGKLRGNDPVFVDKFYDDLNFKRIPGQDIEDLKDVQYPVFGFEKGTSSYKGQRQFDFFSSEMILDEGLPMRFHYRTLKGEG
tara:strand:- start:36 stop:1289 length:1254 start_codon:yes stop_codon:yes gene_type:complete